MTNEFLNTMTNYGFHLTDTGGNCTAFANKDETILITKQSDPEAPQSLHQAVTVGFYKIVDKFPQFNTSQNFPELNAFLKTCDKPNKGGKA